MPVYRVKATMDLTWRFKIEAANEDEAYEKLWEEIGFDGEDILEHDSDSEWLDIDLYLDSE